MEPALAVSIINGIATIAVTVGLFYVGSKTAKIGKLEDQLRAAAADAVDLRFGKLAGDMAGAITTLKTIVAEIQRRLERGDDEFDENKEHRHRLELKTQQQIEELKRTTATREDLRDIAAQLVKLQLTVNRIAGACVHCDHNTANKDGA